MKSKNYYDILGVSVKASAEEITSAKNELAKRYHPDANIKYFQIRHAARHTTAP